MAGQLSPDFLKRLKGKSCFQIKDVDPSTLEQVGKALAFGLAAYREKGWV